MLASSFICSLPTLHTCLSFSCFSRWCSAVGCLESFSSQFLRKLFNLMFYLRIMHTIVKDLIVVFYSKSIWQFISLSVYFPSLFCYTCPSLSPPAFPTFIPLPLPFSTSTYWCWPVCQKIKQVYYCIMNFVYMFMKWWDQLKEACS